ncbi:hypothetical protein SAMN05421856_10916 [Chryseobacterium taichungense]|uniref:Uncharacterized protein n=1 Tax=Chryseobacterium taichungense TaxID=295069 RepID=A0A1H8CED2_9FLAO|nr:hypothetical protein SAMN05421856_10916 [Chryseobacterium taichungense]
MNWVLNTSSHSVNYVKSENQPIVSRLKVSIFKEWLEGGK